MALSHESTRLSLPKLFSEVLRDLVEENDDLWQHFV